jgi:hypothetical protein
LADTGTGALVDALRNAQLQRIHAENPPGRQDVPNGYDNLLLLSERDPEGAAIIDPAGGQRVEYGNAVLLKARGEPRTGWVLLLDGCLGTRHPANRD